MRLLPHRIVVNSDSRFYTLDCYINITNLGITTGKVLTLADGEITVNCSNLKMDSNLKLVARFLLNGQAWKLTGIDDFSKPGTAALTCAKDSITQTDDLIKGVTRAIYADNKTGTTTFAKITNQTGTSCIVSGEAIGYIQLKATLVNDPSVYSWQRSQVKSMI